MHKKLSGRTLQLQIQMAVDELPDDLYPGYPEELDFSSLSDQISKLQQQHLVLCLASWISLNAAWLETDGLVMDRSWLPDGAQSVIMLYGGNDVPKRLFEQAGLPACRHAPVRWLISQLGETALENQLPLVAELVHDLNAIRWNPHRAHCIFIEALDDIMDDGQAWLDIHAAYRNASILDRFTPYVPIDRARGRL